MNIFEMKDRLGQVDRNLAAIEQRVAPSVATRPVSYFPRARLGSPNDWWETLKQWITVGIPGWIGPLADLYRQLVEAGVITPAQAEKGLSKEELIDLIKGIMEEEKKPWYEQPWAPWVICGLASTGVLTAAVAYYVAKKPKK